ncbi:MAG TPA: iron-sulfur cluster repair di-iron protein [Clostridia bacterium]|nr:iron-sulfur cluster repair di-iron protein [Clostridia bacterium]
MFESNQSVGEIVSRMPKAGDIFKQYRIDFCCGGNRTLKKVLAEKGLDEGEILGRLEAAYREGETGRAPAMDFTEMKPVELAEYIEEKHHGYLKKIMPELDELTARIMKVHGLRHSELFKVHKLFAALRAELEEHLVKEEEILFPKIREYQERRSIRLLAEIGRIIRETEDEHEAAGKILKELRDITDDYKVPDDGCGTYRRAYEKLEEMETDVFEHIHLENNILFKKIGVDVDLM